MVLVATGSGEMRDLPQLGDAAVQRAPYKASVTGTTQVTIAAFLAFASGLAWADPCATKDEPEWVSSKPRGYSYDYFSGVAESDANGPAPLRAAVAEAIAEVARRESVEVGSIFKVWQSEDRETFISSVTDEIRVEGRSTTVRGLEQFLRYEAVCADGRRRSAVLVRVPRSQPSSPPSWIAPSLVPSLAQFKKGHSGRGALILGGEIAAIGATTVLAIFHASAKSEADATRGSTRGQDLANTRFYDERAGATGIAAAAAGVAALGIYVYSLIDGVSAAERNTFE